MSFSSRLARHPRWQLAPVLAFSAAGASLLGPTLATAGLAPAVLALTLSLLLAPTLSASAPQMPWPAAAARLRQALLPALLLALALAALPMPLALALLLMVGLTGRLQLNPALQLGAFALLALSALLLASQGLRFGWPLGLLDARFSEPGPAIRVTLAALCFSGALAPAPAVRLADRLYGVSLGAALSLALALTAAGAYARAPAAAGSSLVTAALGALCTLPLALYLANQPRTAPRERRPLVTLGLAAALVLLGAGPSWALLQLGLPLVLAIELAGRLRDPASRPAAALALLALLASLPLGWATLPAAPSDAALGGFALVTALWLLARTRRHALALALALLIAVTAGQPARAEVQPEGPLVVSQEQVLAVLDGTGAPRPGETVRARYRVGLSGERERAVGITDGRGRVRFTPDAAGPVRIQAGEERVFLDVAGPPERATLLWAALLLIFTLAGPAWAALIARRQRRRHV